MANWILLIVVVCCNDANRNEGLDPPSDFFSGHSKIMFYEKNLRDIINVHIYTKKKKKNIAISL